MADIKKKLVDGAGLQAAMGIMADFADKGVRGAIGGYNQSFPLTAATKGNIYYHKGTNRYYICVDNYNGSSLTNPNSKFEELSVYTNRQRLDNLINSLNYREIQINKKVPCEVEVDISNFGVIFYVEITHSANVELIPMCLFDKESTYSFVQDSIYVHFKFEGNKFKIISISECKVYRLISYR